MEVLTMKKEYLCPEFEKIDVTLVDVLLGSVEETIPEIIGGDGDGGDDVIPDF
jgi:hypothetical protein